MLTPEQSKKIGGSDVAALIGASRWKSPIDVYRRIVEGFEGPDTAATRRGTRFEPPIKLEYVDETGAKLFGAVNLEFPGKPFLRASLDDIAERDGERRVLEVKTANFRMAGEWGQGSDDIPLAYLAQVNWYMKASGLKSADVAVLLGGCELRVYTVQGDSELQDGLIERATEFYVNHIKTQKPPEPDASDSYAEWISARYPRNASPLIQSNADADHLAARWREAEVQLAKWELEKEAARNSFRVLLGEAEGVQGHWGKLTWKNNKDSSKTDWEAIAKALKAPSELIAKHTTTKPGPRVLRCAWAKEQ